MIISHQHRYVFIEVPLTGSWAIRHELCEHYGGEPILHKHAGYDEFSRQATPDEKRYFVFATMRNPLDAAVSHYFKLKTNHNGAFTDPQALVEMRVDRADLEKFRFIQETDASFADYFRRYHRNPFEGMIDHSANDLDFVIRYEHLQEDFSQVLNRLGLTQARPIPIINKTQERRSEWQTYYTADIIEQAKAKFGPAMRRWSYDFPVEWGPAKTSLPDELAYRTLALGRRIYLNHFRYNPGLAGRIARSLRAVLTK